MLQEFRKIVNNACKTKVAKDPCGNKQKRNNINKRNRKRTRSLVVQHDRREKIEKKCVRNLA